MSWLARRTWWATPFEALGCLLASLVFCAWSWRANGDLSVRAAAYLFSLPILSIIWGRVLLVFLGAARCLERSSTFTLLVGCLALGLVTAALRFVSPFSLGSCYVGIGLAGAIAHGFLAPAIAAWHSSRKAAEAGLASLIVSLASATFWSAHLFPQTMAVGESTVCRIFNEYYAHTVNFLPLVAPKTPLEFGSYHFAGRPLSFYHFACYTYPALLRDLGGVGAKDTLAALWYPLSLVLVGLAASSLGAAWFGWRAGFWVTVAVMTIPDPTYWFIDITYFSYDRLLEASPGMAYAMAAASVAVVLVTAGIRRQHAPTIAGGLITAFLATFFKVNIIAASLPLCLFLLVFPPARRRTRATNALAAGFVLAVGLAFLGGLRLRSAPTMLPDWTVGDTYMARIATYLPESPLATAWLPWLGLPNRVLASVARALFVPWVTFQVLIVAFGFVWILAALTWRRIGVRGWIPIFSVAVYVGVALLLAPNRNGDPFELQHRTFCWYYFLLVVWTVGTAVRLARWSRFPRFPHEYAVGLCFVAIPFLVGQRMAIPHVDLALPTGFVQSCEYLRAHAEPEEAFVDLEGDPWLVTTALVERRIYSCWGPNYNFPGMTALREMRRERWRELDKLARMAEASDIRAWARKNGVRWCLVHPETPLRWPRAAQAKPAFSAGGYRVYDMESLPD